MKLRHLLCAVILCSSAWVASAQDLKPGLWEVNTKMKHSSEEMEKAMAEMQKKMASMPPEQRKKMQEMMGKQGMGMTDGTAFGIKMCLTKEMVERLDMPGQQGDCKRTNSSRSGNTMKMSFVCTKPLSSGEGQMTFISPEAYVHKMNLSFTGGQGKPEKMLVDSSGKWLASDCGAIKPIPLPGK